MNTDTEATGPFKVGEKLTYINPAVGISTMVNYRGTVNGDACVIFDSGYQITVNPSHLKRSTGQR